MPRARPNRYTMGDFSPDLDPTTPNILTDAAWVYSVLGGWAAMPPMWMVEAPSGSANPLTASLPSQCLGAYGTPTQNGYRIYAGVQQQLYIMNVSVDPAGSAYVGSISPSASIVFNNQFLFLQGGATSWYFTIYGDDVLAADGVNPVYVSTHGTPFVLLRGLPPVFDIIEATDFSLFGIPPHSNLGYFTFNDNQWTPNISTLTGTFSLTSTPGNITAARALRGGIVIYKDGSMFGGQYTAVPSQLWQFNNISKTIGCVSKFAPVAAGPYQYFPGPDNFYQTDGFNVNPIPNNLRSWFFGNGGVGGQLYAPLAKLIKGHYDFINNQILWWYPTDSTGALNNYVSLSLNTGRWSRGFLTGGIDFAIPLQPGAGAFQSAFGANSSLAVILASHNMAVSGPSSAGATYPSPAPYVTTGDVGDKRNVYRVTKVRPGFLSLPRAPKSQFPPNPSPPPNTPIDPPKCSVYSVYVQGQTPQLAVDAVDLSTSGSFNFVTANRLLRFKIRMSSGYQIADAEIDMVQAGIQ